ncbi:hypothetical protein BDR06DRAFT_1012019 [Suillus hirtellus]|nr:hypothetical protein BDR06DRAFT_1012019 [Suillus hirtellus]
MTGSNSESDEEPQKQVPLNKEEVTILESYLEQWDSGSGQERNVIWKDATTEARLKAPKVDKNLLRSQKMVYRKWLQNHGKKKKDTKVPINLRRKWMYHTVVGALQKKELLKKIQDDTGVNPRKLEMMHHYSRYLTDMVNSLTEKEIEDATDMARQWNAQGVPPDIQADTVRRKSEDLLQYVACKMFKKAGMRLFILLAWKSEDDKLMISRRVKYITYRRQS